LASLEIVGGVGPSRCALRRLAMSTIRPTMMNPTPMRSALRLYDEKPHIRDVITVAITHPRPDPIEDERDNQLMSWRKVDRGRGTTDS